MVPGVLLYFIDRLFRFYYSTKAVQVVDIKYSHSGNIKIELKVENFLYKPGNILYLCNFIF